MSTYSFTIYGIEWSKPASDLPDTAVVYLSKYLVEAEVINDEQWNEAINAQLVEQYGQAATSFGFDPTELGEFEEFVSDLTNVASIGHFHSPDDDVLVFIADADDDGRLAIELLEEAIGEVDDCDGYTLTPGVRGSYTLKVTDHDGLADLAASVSDKWDFHNDETGGDFGENDEPREHRVLAKGDEFRVSKIDWVSPNANLPSEVCVLLPNSLVCAERHVEKGEWNKEINDQLQAKYGFRARSFEFAANGKFVRMTHP